MTQFWSVTRNIFTSVIFTCMVYENVAYVAKVEGISMQPTLNDIPRPIDTRQNSGIRGYLNRINSSDYVLLSHWSTRNYDVRRGDIVSLKSPKNPNEIMIKRVIALEGDLITARVSARYEQVKIPPGKCWIEGDNSKNSIDSNALGPVAKGLITAQAKCIVWPPKRWRTLPQEFPSDRLVSPLNSTSSVYENTNNSSVRYSSLQPLNIELRDHRSRIDDAQFFIETTEIH